MEKNGKAKKLRIYLSNTDSYKHVPLYQYITRKAREEGLAGATVYKGIMGYGTSSNPVNPSFWEFVEKVPVTIEIIDSEEKITHFLSTIQQTLNAQPKGCLITMQDVDVVFVKQGEQDKS